MNLPPELEARLESLARALIGQARARIIVPPKQATSGFWFGGGNMIEADDGTLFVVGRYRNYGDSRTGVGAGERGLELAILESSNRGESFQKILSFSKSDLNMTGREVLSIEGSALRWIEGGVELIVSTEKDGIGYPKGFEDHLKPGTGVWTIERLAAASFEELKGAQLDTVVEADVPVYLHVKDPFLYERDGRTSLLFCTHPYSWSSSNTAFVEVPNGEDEEEESMALLDFFPRGTTWDVAITRGTCVLDIPKTGVFSSVDSSLVFYDGGESLRNLDEHASAVKRPRGYSCEELGGAAYIIEGDLTTIDRLSRNRPFFISPHGTGCSRYVDVLATKDGMFATWQQSQPDGSQPLVINFVSNDEIAEILS
ncbi:MAG: exo-alpha-sialidase [Planctomycetes bacterium]|nr:exo-alpha-sialidase [Planctomycetota bacterium]